MAALGVLEGGKGMADGREGGVFGPTSGGIGEGRILGIAKVGGGKWSRGSQSLLASLVSSSFATLFSFF